MLSSEVQPPRIRDIAYALAELGLAVVVAIVRRRPSPLSERTLRTIEQARDYGDRE